jgi:SAM-dependent methyltransferase
MCRLSRHLPDKQYDLVFCWGVLHHCRSFKKAISEVMRFVKNGGILYLYLYGRESLSLEEDLELFKTRLRFYLMSERQKTQFLIEKARGDARTMHNWHDRFAPLINRRFEFDEIRTILAPAGFSDITRTIRSSELYVRAVKGDSTAYRSGWFLPIKEPPYWFEHH